MTKNLTQCLSFNAEKRRIPNILFLVFFLLTFLNGFNQAAPVTVAIKVNQQRMEKRILELAQFGKDQDGKGYRVAFSKGDRDGRTYIIGLMKKAGLETTIDYAGNIIGRRNGKDATKKSISFGSHIDMVPDGGNYDGCLGSIGAIEVIEVLNENKIITEHPLEVIIFSNEEGGVIGSSALVGKIKKESMGEVSQSGLTMAEGIKAIGGNVDSLQQIARKPGHLTAFLELHIEQGGILEKENVQIGIVEGIVGIKHWDVIVEGVANHAGTTPMNARHDALLTAAKFIIAVHDVINSYEGKQVGNIGKISAEPGAFNVIPGKVNLSLEIRDLSSEKILKLYNDIEQKAADIAKSSRTKISFKSLNMSIRPALMNSTIQSKIIASTKMLGLSYKPMQSGAGHDSQEMAEIAPAGMIFVPSIGGISHSPKEFTKATDMANGANVLFHTILAIDKEQN